MSGEAILEAIVSSGEAERARLRAETEARVQEILADAQTAALARTEVARREASAPLAGERARLLHHAKLEALRLIGEARQQLVESALAEARSRLAALRANPGYARLLRRLVEEAVAALGMDEIATHPPTIEADPRDADVLGEIRGELHHKPSITTGLNGWGGVVVRSADGRITVTNTLEARLERALPFLRRDLVTLFEDV
jgi:vacuolar-type H+-ATPase subunit E/Vma4